jgi:hypothetical protein
MSVFDRLFVNDNRSQGKNIRDDNFPVNFSFSQRVLDLRNWGVSASFTHGVTTETSGEPSISFERFSLVGDSAKRWVALRCRGKEAGKVRNNKPVAGTMYLTIEPPIVFINQKYNVIIQILTTSCRCKPPNAHASLLVHIT